MGEPKAAAVVTSSALADLADKYARILALREAHDLARTTGAPEPDPREAMAALAARWPGSLRELDEVPLDELRTRRAALVEAEKDARLVEPWMRAQIVFHAHARAVLAAKRLLAGRKDVDDASKRALAAAGEESSAWAHALAEIARPPRGRLLDLVWPEVARDLGVAEDEARRLVLGARSTVTARR